MHIKNIVLAALSSCLVGQIVPGHDSEVWAHSTSRSKEQIPAAEEPGPAIQALDDEFRKCYSEAKEEILASTSPLIVIAPRQVVLYRNGTRINKDFVPGDYDVMKTIDHLPLAIFVALSNHLDKELSPKKIAELQQIARLTSPVSEALNSTALSAKQIERQRSMIARSLKFIEEVTARKHVTTEEERQFASHLSADSMENAYDSVVSELSRLDQIMRTYKDQMNADEWARLKVIVTGPHMPRLQEHKMMYLAALLGDAQEGHRIIYLENSNEESRALDLAATHILDARIATAYFNDVERMHRDLLSDAAKRYLQEHPPQ